MINPQERMVLGDSGAQMGKAGLCWPGEDLEY